LTSLAPALEVQTPTPPANLAIREFNASDADYAALVEVGNRIYVDYPDTVEEYRYYDQNRPQHLQHRRWLAERDGQAVAYAYYTQHEGMYHPQLFHLSVAVLPEQQGQGVGSALHQTLLAALAPFDPLRLRTRTREDFVGGLRFAQRYGYTEDMREWESRLDVAGFDPTPYAGHEEQVIASGIELVTLAELMQRDPDHRRKLYEFDLELSRDVPHPEPVTTFSYENFVKHVFEGPSLLPEGYFVALDGERYAGLSALWRSQAEQDCLYTGLTGVRSDYRRRGIALALKLRAIAYARGRGIRTLKTWNESNNRPMLSINEQLGFIKQPAWVNMVKVVKEG
jgi:GNAT superfamily N-acetyltransferase